MLNMFMNKSLQSISFGNNFKCFNAFLQTRTNATDVGLFELLAFMYLNRTHMLFYMHVESCQDAHHIHMSSLQVQTSVAQCEILVALLSM